MNPRNPIYIPSKGRADSRLTMRYLEDMKVPYYVVIEEQDWVDYARVIDPKKLLVLPKEYQDNYDTLDNLGDSKSKGPGPARNFAGDHARSIGAKWHWTFDDNHRGYYRFNNNSLIRVTDGSIFRAMEDFCERYEDVTMAGPQYYRFIPTKSLLPPFVINTRIYSCNLIRNDVPQRWRGRYNEDTILSLDMLEAGYKTIQFNAFVQQKSETNQVKGGNTEAFYAHEGTLPKSQMMVDTYPQYSKLLWRFSRWHHYVDYTPFKKNKPTLKKDIKITKGVNNYGMLLYENYPEELKVDVNYNKED